MKLENFITGLAVFGMVIAVMLGYAFFAYSPARMDVSFGEDDAMLQELKQNAEAIGTTVTEVTGDMQSEAPGGTDVSGQSSDVSRSDAITQTGVNILSIIPQFYDLYKSSVKTVARAFDVPPVVVNILIVMVIIAGTFVAVRAILPGGVS